MGSYKMTTNKVKALIQTAATKAGIRDLSERFVPTVKADRWGSNLG